MTLSAWNTEMNNTPVSLSAHPCQSGRAEDDWK